MHVRKEDHFVHWTNSFTWISGCEFQKCNADRIGGGLYLDNFNVSGSGCVGTESGKEERVLRVCYYYNGYQHTEKKEWLKEGMKNRYVGVGGDDASNLCGMSEAAPCKTVGHAVGSSMAQLSSTITVLGGRHVSEGETINVEEKMISVVGKGKTVSVIGTSALSSPATTLFCVSSGQLEVGHVGIDHNAARSPLQSVFVMPADIEIF
ncbi:uncharacterized protein MONOS_5859 [Monocercomonoides exilis]|uniref:uncharacterized protein n=1 Tax=Monocercomonoides exilis TaxID=2049356 RepID=UPI00355A2376|nr:hypothetical protein MONOS_5859 [Monocercomonoides exilis]|eukprot:MONOS_5859.1-p1 / transcript=MONOS_5859.1 / gene=MONOS_5859 / organism=Monocercomonoides_exilis_PA203 / gene_product=unspecified product / transcript_product=unspecified product / location=Mono_scaffold00176:35532-36759(+) / protein_length=207 / sequence_SO=supercontig / SO=protein_coding / is_pseudo=false